MQKYALTHKPVNFPLISFPSPFQGNTPPVSKYRPTPTRYAAGTVFVATSSYVHLISIRAHADCMYIVLVRRRLRMNWSCVEKSTVHCSCPGEALSPTPTTIITHKQVVHTHTVATSHSRFLSLSLSLSLSLCVRVRVCNLCMSMHVY